MHKLDFLIEKLETSSENWICKYSFAVACSIELITATCPLLVDELLLPDCFHKTASAMANLPAAGMTSGKHNTISTTYGLVSMVSRFLYMV